MLASSFLDPVLGIDVHFEMVPTPAPVPTPIPNPFIGLVFDPVGLACGIALGAALGAVMGAPFQGPVIYWTAFPATNTGTEAKAVPGHILIPPGVAWAPFPKTPKPVIHPGETPKPALPIKPEDDAVVVFGSKTVTVMGSNAVRLGDIALSCSEPLRLPSSVVLAVPKGAPILIGGPPSLDIMAAVLASLRTRFVSDSLHALLSRLKPSRFRNLLNRAVCFFTGHPVDVASGKVMTQFVDAELPGPLPLKIERIYSSAFASRPGPVGHGWSFSLNQAIWRERGKVVLLAEDGREIEFDTFDFAGHRIAAGQSVYNPIERLTLHCDSGECWRVIDHEGQVRGFAGVAGRTDGWAMIQRVRSRCGFHEIGYSYDEQGRLAWVRDSGGRLIGLVHDASGRLSELHLPNPHGEGFYRHRRHAYDAQGDLVEVVDSLGKSWRFAYESHLLTQETDRNGLSFHFAYDALGEDAWCVRTWGDGGIYDHALSYDKQKHVTWVTNSLGYTTQYHMNLVGQVVKVVDPLGGTMCFEYDPLTLRQSKVVDALGQETAFRCDAQDQLVEHQAPGRGTWVCTRDERGLPVNAVDGVGGQWSWTHDPHGRLIERVDPNGAQHHCTYERGLLKRITGSGCDIVLEYDSQQNLTRKWSPRGALDLKHDALGRLISTASRETGHERTLTRDLEGNVVTTSTSEGDVRQLRYDAEGWLIEAQEHGRRTIFEYAGLHWLARKVTGGTTVTMSYDTEGRLTSVSKGNGERHQFEFDPVGGVVRERGFDGRVTHYTRNVAGRVTKIIRPSGRRTDLEYDGAGRIARLQHGDGCFQSYEYRNDGALVRADNEGMSVILDRDLRGRVLGEQVGGSWVTTAYSVDGFQTERRTSSGLVESSSYDPASRTKSILAVIDTDEGDLRWGATMHFDAGGHEHRRAHQGDLVFQWERDGAGRVRRWSAHPPSRTDVQERRYAWGPHSRLDEVADFSWHGQHGSLDLERRYTYDGEGRLTEAKRSDGREEHRTFDAADNVHRDEGGSNRVYADGGRLVIDGEVTNTYDEDGRILERVEGAQRTQFRWDDGGLLREVLLPTGERVEFCYDALGRRHHKRVFDTTSNEAKAAYTWQWSGNVPVHERSQDGLMTWIYEPDSFVPAAQMSQGRAWTLATDPVGTPTEMFGVSGELVWRRETDMDGNVRHEGGDIDCPLRWPGQYFDRETGLHYNRWRYYDPRSSGYLSPDPMGLLGGLRPHGYPLDPLTHADPFGLIDPWDILFSQNSISDTFLQGPWAGRTLEEAIEATRAAGRLPEGLNLNVMMLNDEWVTLNNRTLYVAQQANLSQVHPNDMGPRGTNQLNKLLDGKAPLPLGEQPEVRKSCS